MALKQMISKTKIVSYATIFKKVGINILIIQNFSGHTGMKHRKIILTERSLKFVLPYLLNQNRVNFRLH